MKRLIIILSAVALLASCGNGLERKAERQMRKTMLELAKNPETLKVDNVKAVISNDSLCVLSFIARGQNGFGGYNMSRYEYYFIKHNGDGKDRYSEYIEEIGGSKGNRPFNEQIDKFLRKNPDMSKEHGDMTADELRNSVAYILALMQSALAGREIEE